MNEWMCYFSLSLLLTSSIHHVLWFPFPKYVSGLLTSLYLPLCLSSDYHHCSPGHLQGPPNWSAHIPAGPPPVYSVTRGSFSHIHRLGQPLLKTLQSSLLPSGVVQGTIWPPLPLLTLSCTSCLSPSPSEHQRIAFFHIFRRPPFPSLRPFTHRLVA